MAYKVNDKIFRRVSGKLMRYIEKKLPKDSLTEFKKNTPVGKTYNARRNTKLEKNINGFTINADYDYSGVIDRGEYPKNPVKGTGKTRNGYSTQAPKGMIEPTIEYIEKELNKRLRRNR